MHNEPGDDRMEEIGYIIGWVIGEASLQDINCDYV